MTIFITTVIICTILIITLLLIVVYLKLRNPICGGYVDPNLKYCDAKGHPKQGTTPADCDPKDSSEYDTNLLGFLEYITRVIRQNEHSFLYPLLQHYYQKVYKGIFIFAVPELLKVLPTDFGNNATAPYGMVSFYDSYIPCIQDVDQLCNFLLAQSSNSTILKVACQEYFTQKQRLSQGGCPFHLTDHTSDITIKDTPFFNTIGLIGVFSLSASQAVILYTDIPVKDLNLNYWSYNVYAADNLDPNASCYPYRQVNVASIAPPLNLYTAVSISGKKFNPLTGEGTVVKGHVRFYTIFAMNKTIAETLRQDLSTFSKISPDAPEVDFIHIFEIPAGDNSMIIQGDLQNPNHLSTSDPLFQASYQRLCIFLRASPSPHATQEEQDRLKDFIYERKQYKTNFYVNLVDFEETLSSNDKIVLYDSLTLPPTIHPPVNEPEVYGKEFKNIGKHLRSTLRKHGFFIKHLPTRNSILNIIAPRFRNILNTKKPYQGGYQALQLAGNAQADNYDTHYRPSKTHCLTDHDLFVAFCMNHSFLGNCVYNSVNVIDLNKAYGYDAVVLDKQLPYTYYIVIIGRSIELIHQTERTLKDKLGTDNILFLNLYVKTGNTIDGNIPLCHQVLMLERCYLNTLYPSITDPQKIYSLFDLFGDDFTSLNESENQDAWDSLKNTALPELPYLIPPVYMKVSYSPNWIETTLLWIALVLVVVVLVYSSVWLLRSRIINKKKRT